MSADERKDPDGILNALTQIGADDRGKLRIFLGMCPGVGKTYAMLEAARQQSARGTRVVVGVVETHGRAETLALTEGLTIYPRIVREYRGTPVSEFDLDGILRDRPALVIVDELAHTNAPGSRHLKRYQDIEELLAAGIDVFTTINIQHVESRNDQVAQITGVIVRETVPDSFIERARQIEVVDLPPAVLLERMRDGKVYLGEQANRAIEGFFRPERLMALRELALRFVAETVDQDLHRHMVVQGVEGPWNTNERLLVAVSHSPYSPRLVRTARRMAYALEAPWVALYVDTGSHLEDADRSVLRQNLELARELGAEVITIADADVAHAIRKVSHERNVTQIIMGRPDRRLMRDLWSGGTLLDRLVRETSRVDVHVLRAERKPRFARRPLAWPRPLAHGRAYVGTAALVGMTALICRQLLPELGYQTLGSIFLLAILIVAGLTTTGPIVFAAFASALVWNFFFIPPTWTFTMSKPQDTVMLLTFFVVAVVGGWLTSRIKRQESILERREAETRLLYDLTNRLAGAGTERDAAQILLEVIQRQFRASVSVLLGEDVEPLALRTVVGLHLPEREMAVALWSYANQKSAGWSTSTLSAADSLCLPLRGGGVIVGVLAVIPSDPHSKPSMSAENFLAAVVSQSAIALERLRLRREARG